MSIPALAPPQEAQRPAQGAPCSRDPESGGRFEEVLDGEREGRNAGSNAGSAAGELVARQAEDTTETGKAEGESAEWGAEPIDFACEPEDSEGRPEVEKEPGAPGPAGEPAAGAAPSDGSGESDWDAAVTRALAQVRDSSGSDGLGNGGTAEVPADPDTTVAAVRPTAGETAATATLTEPGQVPSLQAETTVKVTVTPPSEDVAEQKGADGAMPAVRVEGVASAGETTAKVETAAHAAAMAAGAPAGGEREISPREARIGSSQETAAWRTDSPDRPTLSTATATADQAGLQQTRSAAAGFLQQAGAEPLPDLQRAEGDGPVPQHGGAQAPNATPADAIARSAAPAAQAPTATPLRQVADAVVTARGDQIEIALSPEELGKVRITISHSDMGLFLNLSADRQETLGLLRRHAEELSKSLAEMGLGSADIGFSDDRTPRDGSAGRSGFAAGGETAAPLAIPIARPESLRAAMDGRMDLRL